MRKRNDLPPDINKFIMRKTISRVCKFVFIELVALLSTIFIWVYYSQNIKALILVSLALQLFICWFTGIYKSFTDRTWKGVIVSIKVEEKTGVFTNGSMKSYPYTKQVLFLTVKKQNGSVAKVKADEFGIREHQGYSVPLEGNVELHLSDYKEGDVIYHFYGLDHLYVVSNDMERTTNCVICGSSNSRKNRYCYCCKHSLLHIDE